jgi:hypothetical protein
MVDWNGLDALTAAGQALVLASLVYFFYLVLRYGELLRHVAHEGDQRPLRVAGPEARAMYLGEAEHGAPENVLEEIAASAARMARTAR